MLRTSIALVVLVGSVSFAQAGDEWSTFPPKPPAAEPAKVPPAAAQPAAQPTPAPAAQPKPVNKQPATTPVAQPKPAAPQPKAAQVAEPEPTGDEKDTKLVSRKERFEAGTEPHSPSTWGNAWSAPENARVSVGQVGLSAGFLPTARMGAKGVVRVSLLGEYLSLMDFPVRTAQDIRSAVSFAASFQPFEWGEIFVSYGASANTNNRTAPNLIQTLGDFTFGIKASHQFTRGLYAGADLRLLTFSGVGNQGIDRFAVGFRPTLLLTWDVRSVTEYLPLVLTLNAGVTLDTTGGLVTNQKLNASEEFALNVNRHNRFNFGVAAEIPFPVVTPFIEYAFGLPLGVTSLTGPDGVDVSVGAAMTQTLGLGLKITAIKDLTLITGVNLGLARSVGLGVPATPPWNFWFGASFAIDPFQRGETKFVDTVRERKVEIAKAPPAVRVEGTVTDVETKKPIAGAVISVAGVRPSATNETGQYQTLELTGQKVKLVASRDGYKPVEREVTLEAGKPAVVDLALEADVKKAKFLVTTTAAKKPVKATVAFTGVMESKVETVDGVAAPNELELPAGQYVVTANAEGFLAQTREVQVTPGASLPVAFDLVPSPKKPLVIFKGDKIEILQQVHFLTGKATILADSFNLLQQVVDAVVKNNVKKIRVEGHTDNRGDKTANQALSEARARAIGDYLTAQGVEKSRVDAVGYGDSKPIAPNLTARGRELNRRVEFIVLEK